jgi:Spy/CpxP family protein refolding chaperone
MRLLRELDLNETQRQQIRSIMEEVEATGAPARLRESRRALHEAIEAGADEATLRQAASQLGEAEGDAAVEWVRARARIQEILTDEQKKELEELEREAEERMDLDRRHREEQKARKSKSGANLL